MYSNYVCPATQFCHGDHNACPHSSKQIKCCDHTEYLSQWGFFAHHHHSKNVAKSQNLIAGHPFGRPPCLWNLTMNTKISHDLGTGEQTDCVHSRSISSLLNVHICQKKVRDIEIAKYRTYITMKDHTVHTKKLKR